MSRQRILVVILLLAAAGIVAFLYFRPQLAQTATLSGYVEGEPLYPAAPVAGTLVSLNVKRGDVVAAGAPLFAVDPAQIAAQKSQGEADVAAAKALAEDARKGQRPAELGVIQAQVASAEANLTAAQRNLARIRPLYDAGAASRQDLDAAIAAEGTADAAVKAAQKQLQAARLGARSDQVAAADERVRQAQATVDAAEARLADLSPKAPAAGRIEDVYFQTGEWVNGNQPVLSLIPDDRVRLRFFVPEKDVSTYTIGREVNFACDGCAAGLTAKINYVSPRPEFTPPVIYSREARDRLVFMVEALPAQPKGLTPGLPVDVSPLKPQ